MARLIWTPSASKDVARLHAFLASKNRDACPVNFIGWRRFKVSKGSAKLVPKVVRDREASTSSPHTVRAQARTPNRCLTHNLLKVWRYGSTPSVN